MHDAINEAMNETRQLDILKIVCAMAWADGEVSSEERQLLTKLVARYFPPVDGDVTLTAAADQLAAWTVDSGVIEEVLPRLPQAEDRMLALKLCYMVAGSSQRRQDSSPINADEKALLRQLVEALQLTEAQVREVEWAAQQELQQGKGLLAVLGTAFAGLGAWPSEEMLRTPGMQWL